MNFVAQVEEHLRDLGTEARRKHPGVKEASERAILQLRALQTTYVSLVRRSSMNTATATTPTKHSAHPTTSVFQSQEILRPFLLAANYPDVNYSILSLVFNAFLLLIQGDAICQDDGVYLVRVLSIQANVCCSAYAGIGRVSGGNGSTRSSNSNNNNSSSSGGKNIVAGVGMTNDKVLNSHSNTSVDMNTHNRSSSNYISSAASGTISSIGSSIMSGFGMLSSSSTSGNQSNSSGNKTDNVGKGNASSSTTATSSSSTSILGITIGTGGYSSTTGKTGRSLKEDEALSIRILQIVTMIIDSRQSLELTEEILSQCLAICFTFISATSHGIGGGYYGDVSSTGSSTSGSGGVKKVDKGSTTGGDIAGGSGGSGDKATNVTTSANKVKRAAIATLRQIISIVFDRAATESALCAQNTVVDSGKNETSTSPKSEPEKKSVSLIASRLFLDLCDLAEFGSGINATKQNMNDLESQLKERGPFSQALLGGGIGHQRMSPPPRSVCFDLLEMIVSQQVELFTKKSSNEGEKEGDDNTKYNFPDFASLLQNRLCPVLSNMLTSEFVTGLDHADDEMIDRDSEGSSNNRHHRRHRSSHPPESSQRLMAGDNPASFALLMTLTKLAGTIITLFGTHSSSSLDSECHVLIVSLVKYVKAATEVIRDSHDFEDGFVYSSKSKSEIQHLIGSNKSRRDTMPYASSHVLWRAAITLELLYGLVSDNFDSLYPLFESRNGDRPCDTLLSVVIEAIVDFSVVVSSNKAGIISVVEASAKKQEDNGTRDDDNPDAHESNIPMRNFVFDIKTIHPFVTSQARNIIKSRDEWNRRSLNESFPECDLGTAAWVGFHFVLVVWKSLQRQSRDRNIFVEGSFASSLSLIQHFLRRFQSSDIICKDALSGYKFVAETVLPFCHEENLKRRLILTSLCKLSLPSDEKGDQSYDILDHHVAAQCLLIEILHLHADEIMNDWSIILSTLESLNLMSLSLRHLSADSSDALMVTATVFSNIGHFTCCFSNDSINIFMDSLLGMTKTTRRLFGSIGNSATMSSFDEQENDSIKRKIMSYAGHALNKGASEHHTDASDTNGVNKTTNPIALRFRSNLQKKLSNVPVRDSMFHELPFALILLADIVIENRYRFRVLSNKILSYLSDLAASSSSVATQSFAYDLMAYLISQGLRRSDTSKIFQRIAKSRLTPGIVDCFKTTTDSTKPIHDVSSLHEMSHEELLKPLCHAITNSSKHEAAEIGLQKLKGILELGLDVSGAWLLIIQSLTSLSGGAGDETAQRSSTDWSICCTNAFGCLRLIVDDFLDSDESKTFSIRTALLDCCVSFGRSRHDVNISLTATGMLWTIADDSPTSVDHVLASLALLASDNRVEVRNCSVNTLFSCVVGCGQSFTENQWRQLINEIILCGILDSVSTHNHELDNDSSASTSSRYTLSRHHSRDTDIKQWTTTKVLILQGIERVFRIFFDQLLTTSSSSLSTEEDSKWFYMSFETIVELAYNCSIQDGGRESLELRTAGVDLLSLCCQVCSRVGIIAGDVRVGTNMQVVNGALRSVRVPHKIAETQTSPESKMQNPIVESIRQSLFGYAFGFVMKYNYYLSNNESMRKANDSFPTSLDNTVLQVLTKLSQGLAHIYDCCKDNELTHSAENDNEARFVELVSTIVVMASAPGSKYLTQVQRFCFEILENMSMNASLCAYKALAALFYCMRENSMTDEALHEEAAKILNRICNKVSKNANVIIFDMMLHEIVKETYALKVSGMLTIAPFIKASLSSSRDADASTFDFNSFWTNSIIFLKKLYAVDDESGIYELPCNELLDLMDCWLESLPTAMYHDMCELLIQILNESVMIATKDDVPSNTTKDSLHVFQKCFRALCLLGDIETIQSTAHLFLQRSESSSPIDVEVARITCSTLSSLDTNDVAIKLFPSICNLMNSHNSNLRKEAAQLMSKVDVASVITKNKNTEDDLSDNVDVMNQLIKDIEREKHRADNAEKDVAELREINSQLMKEVEQLRVDKERLQQQVAVYSEGSAYIM